MPQIQVPREGVVYNSARLLELITDEHQVLDCGERRCLVLSGDEVAVDDHVHPAGRGARVARAAVPQTVLEQRRTLREVALQTLVEQRRRRQTDVLEGPAALVAGGGQQGGHAVSHRADGLGVLHEVGEDERHFVTGRQVVRRSGAVRDHQT